MSALRRRRAARPRTSAAQIKPNPLAAMPANPAAARPSVAQQTSELRLQSWRVILRVFLPFTAAFFMAYLFRSINALIASDLSAELALDAADIGLLTSVYFLTFAALQVPVGIWLDRYGPRRVEATLMLFAVVGALLFAMSKGFALLTLSRALIGLGVAAAFTGGLKAIAQWFPKDRVSTMNGYLLMLGALGALSATSPARVLLDWGRGWRGLFVILAAATAVCTLTIWIAVPEAASARPPVKEQALASLKAIYSDSRFWRVAPLSATCAGTTWALQSLWAAPWLTDVDGLPAADVTSHLLIMAIALCGAAVPLGMIADRLRRRGIGPQVPLGVVATIVIAAQLALILRWPVPSWLCWSIVAAAGSAPVLSYAILADFFPKEITGRANGALNLFHFGGAFAVQYLIGVILALWPNQGGHYPAIAYQVAFGLNLSLQAIALAWFVFSWSRGRWMAPVSALRRLVLGWPRPAFALSTRRRAATSRDWLDAVDRQVVLWRLAGLGSASLTALLGLTFAISVVRANMLRPAVVTARRDELVAVLPKIENTPSDAQIAYALADFIKDVRSLSADPIVVRANWTDALDHVTARGAQALDAYARDEAPFDKIGRRTVTVLVTKVVRTGQDTFEVRWEEQIIENSAAARRERFMAAISLAFSSPNTSGLITKNPLGLYVDRLTCSRDPVAMATDEHGSR
jgi:type IV secretory pathway TrbF-like protein/predicted MFS family arabinose efflux permease